MKQIKVNIHDSKTSLRSFKTTKGHKYSKSRFILILCYTTSFDNEIFFLLSLFSPYKPFKTLRYAILADV